MRHEKNDHGSVARTYLLFCFSSEYLQCRCTNSRDGWCRYCGGDYLSAGNYNPALAAFDPETGIGIIFPAIGATMQDQDDFVKSLEDFKSVYDAFQADPTNQDSRTSTANALRNLKIKMLILTVVLMQP